jgi:putative flippase GtrA
MFHDLIRNKKLNSLIQFISYICVGGINFLIDIAILNLLWFLTGRYTGEINYLFKFISFCIYSTTGYFLNRKITFRSSGNISSYIRYLALLGFLSALDAVIIVHLTQIHIESIPVQIWSNYCVLIAGMSTGILGFLINKFVIFKNSNL